MAAPISFDAHGTNGVTLFDLAKQWAPLSTAETYAYTNPAISSEEIKRLVSVAIHSDYKAARDFVEYVAHSESRVTFEDEIVSRLDDPSSQNRSWAIDRIAELKTPRLARRLSQRMADPVEWIKTRAGWALTEMDGDVNMNAVLPEIISTNGEIRTVALAVAVRHGGSDSESLNRLGLQIDDVISQHGTNAFPKADRRRVKLTADRRHTLKSLLDRLKSAGIDTEMFRDRTPPPRPEFE